MNELKIFEKEEFGQVRTLVKDSEPWFVGKDVAEILGFSNTRDAIATHVFQEDKGVDIIDTLGGKQQVTIINESGLYALVFGSRLDTAKRFKRWITSEVIPTLRKTGTYSVQPIPTDLQILQGMLNELIQQKTAINEIKQQSEKAIATSQAIKEAIVEEYDNWRDDIKHKVSAIQKKTGETYADTWNKLYSELEKRGRCDLSIRVNNGRFRLQESGATKKTIEAYGRLDVIEADPRLKEIFTAIVKEHAAKHVA